MNGPEAAAFDRRAVERWFIRRGVPHFIEGYDAGDDIFTRSIPALVIAYLAGGFTALDIYRWSAARNLAVGCGIVALALATWVAANGVRGRPWFERPRRVGRGELAVFVLGPAVPAAVFGQQWGDAFEAVVIGLGVLLAIYVITSYALLPLTRWAFGRLVDLLAVLGSLVARALPLLLLIVTFSFLGAEVWEMAATLPLTVYPAVLGVFLVAGAAFLLSRLPAEIGSIGHFDTWAEVGALLADSPACGCPLPTDGDARPPAAGLTRRQWVNLALVSLFTQGVQITLVAMTMGLFLTLFGFLAISEQTIVNWTQLPQADVLVQVAVGGRDLVLTRQLLQVAGFLATFTGFYFTVVAVTDETYRREFRDDVVTELRESLAVRAAYRHHVHAGA
ncbi:MAG: hypothetical protein R2755_24420 [Acidimicrobiales bacterium]